MENAEEALPPCVLMDVVDVTLSVLFNKRSSFALIAMLEDSDRYTELDQRRQEALLIHHRMKDSTFHFRLPQLALCTGDLAALLQSNIFQEELPKR